MSNIDPGFFVEERSKEGKKIPVVEIFGPTVQGEGAVIGCLTHFIRFGLCDYKCTMCDSMHAVDPHQVKANATYMTQVEILSALEIHATNDSVRWVTFSGGNPCIHDLSVLALALKERGWKIAVETQGTFSPEWLQHCDVITVSPKGPGMGEMFEPDKFIPFVKRWHHYTGFNIKCVVFDERDLEFASMIYEMVQDGMSWHTYPTMPPFYLSQGNPFPPGLDASSFTGTQRVEQQVDILRKNYLMLLEDICKHPLLAGTKFLPQFHVWLWGNRQGV